MTIRTDEIDNVIVFTPEGKFMGGSESLEFRDQVELKINKGYKKLGVDFSKLDWANSMGIGMVISAYLTSLRNDCDMRMANLSERVAYYFKLSKLDSVFRIFATVEEAIASFEK